MRVLPCLALLVLLATPALAAQPQDGAWGLDLGPDNTFFPSLAAALSTLRLGAGADPRELGDPNGLLGLTVVAPRDGAKAEVEIATAWLIATSRITVTLPKKGVRYAVYPYLKCNPEQLVLIRQPFAETVTGKLSLDGQPQGEKTGRITVRSINDCVYGYDEDGRWNDTTWLYAAYVNENHPKLETILKEALSHGDVDSFSGYQGDDDDVREEVEAIWDTLARRGIRYSSISKSSAESANTGSQHVRLLGEALAGRQANCVEGACLLASLFYKIGLNTALVCVPGHMFVSVDLDEDGKKKLYLETTLLTDDDSSFEDAVEDGLKQYKKHRARLSGDPRIRWRDKRPRKKGARADDDEYGLIDIRTARELGILPIREPGADKARFR